MIPGLHIDFETRSCADLPRVGAARYALDSTTEIICMAWRFTGEGDDFGPRRWWGIWMHGETFPEEILRWVAEGRRVVAHNAAFERWIWNAVLLRRNLGLLYPALVVEQMDCTLARAAAVSLPQSLDGLAKVLGLAEQKDSEGYALMMKYCKPRRIEPDGTIVWWNDPSDLRRLGVYCGQDVATECSADELVPPLSDFERRVWELDQRINDRGFAVDLPFVRKALAAVGVAKRRADERMAELTGGAVRSVGQVARLKVWLAGRGIPTETLRHGDEELVISFELTSDAVAEEAVRLRWNASKTFKFQAMLDIASPADGRVRGSLAYSGTIQRRWAGRGVQPHNMKRIGDHDEEMVEDALWDLGEFDDPEDIVDALQMTCGAPLEALSLIARPMIIAERAKRLIGADASNIEGRFNAWNAGEQWKLQAFRDYDAGIGPDMYRTMAALVVERPVETVTRDERQTKGKVPELACLGPDTQLFTTNGFKNITEITAEDRLWDGVEWIEHEGLISRGSRKTVQLGGVELTADHLCLVGQQWWPAQLLVLFPGLHALALETCSGNLPSWATPTARPEDCERSLFDVRAALNRMEFLSATSGEALPPAVRAALLGPPGVVEKSILATLTSSPTTPIGAGSSTELQPASTVVTIPTTTPSITTAAGVFWSSPPGEQVKESFWPTLLRLKAGTTRLWNLIEKTLIKAMSRVTSGLSRTEQTKKIVERLRYCSSASTRWSCTYDIVHAGPRNRFMIMSRNGPLLVHNCGYQGGLVAFQKMAHTQRPPVIVSDAQATKVVALWRERNPRIVMSWEELQDAAINAVDYKGTIFTACGGKIRYVSDGQFLMCELPSKGIIHYPAPTVEWKQKIIDIDGEEVVLNKRGVTYRAPFGKRMVKQDLYGGAQCAHVISGMARDYLCERMFEAEEAGYKLVLTVHDELLAECLTSQGSVDEFAAIMGKAPAWAPGLPVAAKAWEDTRYVK